MPRSPSIFHITHIDNLASIVANGLYSDATLQRTQGISTVGMSRLKKRRLTLPIAPHPGLHVGDCVPFYFCPRSVMLFILHRRNHPDVTYRGGQEPILHLEASLEEVVAWADEQGLRWAFSLSNAAVFTASFRSDLEHLDQIDWKAVQSTDFRDRGVRERKQAELLIEERFPWSLVRRIGVRSGEMQARVQSVLAGAGHRPRVDVLPRWYY